MSHLRTGADLIAQRKALSSDLRRRRGASCWPLIVIHHITGPVMPSVSRAGLAHFAVVALACISAGWTVQAQSEAMPAIQTQGAVRYACGGIGSDESAAMRAAMKQFPLSLLFARPDGGYLADVDVAILAADGRTVLAMRSSGPVCLVDLPPGRYDVAAASGGVGKTHSVSIGGAPVTTDFRFER